MQVEELYPSCRSLRADHPQYGTSSLVDRVRALCLWFNVTRSLQLKIDIIGHMLLSLPSKGLPWPLQLSWPTGIRFSFDICSKWLSSFRHIC